MLFTNVPRENVMVDSNSNFIQRHHKGNRGGDGRGHTATLSLSKKITVSSKSLVLHTVIHGARRQRSREQLVIGHSSLSIKAFWLYAATLWRTSLKTSCWMKKESLPGLRTKFCMKDCGMSSSVLSWPRTLMRIPPSNMGWQSTAVMR